MRISWLRLQVQGKKKRQTAAQSSNVLKLTTRQIVGQDISVEPHTHTLHLVLNPFPPATI